MHLERGLDALEGPAGQSARHLAAGCRGGQPGGGGFPGQRAARPHRGGLRAGRRRQGHRVTGRTDKAWVRSDRILLGRIVRNLVENAVRYTEHGRVLVDCLPRGERLRIEVRDSGIGIPSEHIEQIWDEFHQVGNPERDRTQGLGLGLTIVKRIADPGMFRRCPVQSRKGSVFAIEVPLGEAKPQFAPAGKPVRPVSANENADGKFAVLVDDDAIVLLGLQMLMKQLGYKVLIAASTEQAIGQLREVASKPDIVVADYRLREGKVGTEAILRIRELFGTEVPGIILTGETGAECEQDAASHGLRIIHKPVTPRQLEAAIQNQIRTAQ